MTREQIVSIRKECKTDTQVKVAAKYGVTRQRVHQIVHGEHEDERRRYISTRPVLPPSLKGEQTVGFRSRHKHLADAAVQQAIRELAESGLKNFEIAAIYGCTDYAIQRILLYYGTGKRRVGRPKRRQGASALDTSYGSRAITTAQ